MSPRRTTDELGETPLSLVYIAGNLADAHHVERLLDERNIEYAVSLETFTTESPMVFGGEYRGVFFYVPHVQHQMVCQLLQAQGLKDTVDEE
jgi:hypothetical protein